GAGPMHAAALADELGVREVVIPPNPGLFSAVGLLAADLRCDRVESVMRPFEQVDPKTLETRFRRLEAEAREGVSDGGGRREVVLQRALDLRYVGQSYELTVPGAVPLPAAAEAFRTRHTEIYGYAPPREPVEVVNARVTALGIMPPLSLWEAPAGPRASDPAGARRACLGVPRPAVAAGRRRGPDLGPARPGPAVGRGGAGTV